MRPAIVLLAAAVAAAIAGWASDVIIRHSARGRRKATLTTVHRKCHRPWTAVIFVVALLVALPLTDLPRTAVDDVRHILVLALIFTGAWLCVKLLFAFEEISFRRYPVNVANNRRMRRMRTRIAVSRRATATAVIVLAAAAALMTFPHLRSVGASLFASAGIAGVVVGLAAKPTLSNFVAGLQLAFTDMLRLDDAVLVDNEWGRVEDLGLTHVVVQLWDERRVVLPTTYFTTQPFENWTRREARVLGSVLLHLDHTTPMADVREQTRRIAEASQNWDGIAIGAQVIDTTPTTMIVRIVASAVDGPRSWNLRCELREGLIDYLRQQHPECLPRARVTIAARDAAEIDKLLWRNQ